MHPACLQHPSINPRRCALPAVQAGVGAIVHPGGSMRDQDAIDCCNK